MSTGRKCVFLRPAMVMGLASLIWGGVGLATPAVAVDAREWKVVTVTSSQSPQVYSAEGVVTPVRSAILSATVPGRVTQLSVKVGDVLKAGAPIASVDERVANSQANASEAQVAAAKAQLEVARTEYERTKSLFAKRYVSQSAMEQAQAQWQAAQAQSQAASAQATAARTAAGLARLVAPFPGVVSAVETELGAMAMPGQALVKLHDPSRMRVDASVPVSMLARLARSGVVSVEVPSANLRFEGLSYRLVPAADAATQSIQVRVELPLSATGLPPGSFAKVVLPYSTPQSSDGAKPSLNVPMAAVFRRADLTAVYVMDSKGKPQLRQVRLGRAQGGAVEILSGLSAGEKIVAEPTALGRDAL